MDIGRLHKLKAEAETMQYLKAHDENMKKVYSDVNFVALVQSINLEIEAYYQQPKTEEEYYLELAEKLFS